MLMLIVAMFTKLLGLLPLQTLRPIAVWMHAFPILRPLLEWGKKVITSKIAIIQGGAGKGLRFDSGEGGYPGQVLGSTDLEEQQALVRCLQSGSVFYDVGANVGFYVIIGARTVGPNGHVYAFEPFPSSIRSIQRNVALNEFDNVSIINKAVSNQVNVVALACDAENSQVHRIGPGTSTLEVDCVTIDAFMNDPGHRPPDVVMVDVEGHELQVLEGMSETLRRYRPTLIVEVHELGDAFVDYFRAQLEPIGYTALTVTGGALPREKVRFHALLQPAPLLR